jgi:hypothetical protein
MDFSYTSGAHTLYTVTLIHPYTPYMQTHNCNLIFGFFIYYTHFIYHILIYSSESRIRYEESFIIYDTPSKETQFLLIKNTDSLLWPGILRPALRITGPNLYFEFINKDIINQPMYGYKMHVVPVFKHRVDLQHTVIEHNYAGGSGGGMYLYSGIKGMYMLNAHVQGNR